MTSDTDHKLGNGEDDFLAVLAKINEHMMSIRKSAESNPAVVAATRGCDVRRYRDLMMEEEVHYFEAYVEATTRTGHMFCWSLDIKQSSRGWELQRRVDRQTSEGGQEELGFNDLTFDNFDELADNYTDAMNEFAESARNFNFPLQT